VAAEAPEPSVTLGLRERKKLETRQRISDLATQMFVEQGYDAVRVADIAARAGISEKTVYNYFPTKESLVFDQADAQLEGVLRAVSERTRGVSPLRAYLDETKRQMQQFADPEDFDQVRVMIPAFGRMLEAAPALRAAWGGHRDRMVTAVAEVLAADLGVDALDPEPRTAARALVSLTELQFDSVLRNIWVAQSAAQLCELVESDLERGARLLDSGMWSLPVMIGGRRSAEQLREAAGLAELARHQVISALGEARRAWLAVARDPEWPGPGRPQGGRPRGDGGT
jgi:AcrR family transcriptional regulator